MFGSSNFRDKWAFKKYIRCGGKKRDSQKVNENKQGKGHQD